VTTVVNGVNDSQVGPIFDFSIANCDALDGVSFQPVSFTGRDEEVTDEERRARRYTISHLAQALCKHTGGKIDPYRDWFPLGAMGAFGALADHLRSLRGPDEHTFGAVNCSCHPNCGSSVVLVANTRTKEWATITQFFDLARFMDDIAVICDSARGRELSFAQIAMSFLRNYDASKAPPGFSLLEFVKLFFYGKFRGAMGKEIKELWTYDFRRTEMCVIPYGTQEGEISFCAYNTGVGWRQIVENMHSVASTKEWFETRGRHRIYAGNRPIPLAPGRRLPIMNEDGRASLGAHISQVRQ
jgi:uncharacterized radical SAM superfamily Fe-S cluster-containing enzyme